MSGVFDHVSGRIFSNSENILVTFKNNFVILSTTTNLGLAIVIRRPHSIMCQVGC